MAFLHRHENCIGVPLYKNRTKYIELWICPANYLIQEHSHQQEDIELMYIFGKTTFFRRVLLSEKKESFRPKWYHIFKKFTIPHGWLHGFNTSRLPLIFINFSTFINGYKPVSASEDFKPIKE